MLHVYDAFYNAFDLLGIFGGHPAAHIGHYELFGEPVYGLLDGRDLLENLRAVAARLHHPLHTIQLTDYSIHSLACHINLFTIPPTGIQYMPLFPACQCT